MANKLAGLVGEPVIIRGGPPMHLTATGTERRRALVLILHEANPRRQRITGRPRGCAKANSVLSIPARTRCRGTRQLGFMRSRLPHTSVPQELLVPHERVRQDDRMQR